MDFGKVSNKELQEVDFTLPGDGQQTAIVLPGKKSENKLEAFVGCAKWGRKEWKGLIYPENANEADFLSEYVKHFKSIEMNAVFYSIPNIEIIQKFKSKVDQHGKNGFLFFPKISRQISHIKMLKDCEDENELFFSSIREFKEMLGPCLLQIPDNFSPKNYQVLENYIKSVPKDIQLFVEIRNEEWFSNPVERNRVFQMFSENNVGSVITDSSGRRDCVHMELSKPEIFIRFIGNGEGAGDSDFRRIDEWVYVLKSWQDKGLEKVYFFLHQHDDRDTPILAKYTIEQFNKHLGSNIPEINLMGNEN